MMIGLDQELKITYVLGYAVFVQFQNDDLLVNGICLYGNKKSKLTLF